MAGGDAFHLERWPTYVPGLDHITLGGLFKGGTYLVAGAAGAGKTVLAAQMCFGAAKAGARSLYVTLLTETHARMLANLRSFDFFAPDATTEHIAFISGYPVLLNEGLSALVTLVRDEIQRRNATFLVVDGLSLARSFAESEVAAKRFVHDLQAIALAFQCTTVLLTDATGPDLRPEEALVEGVIELQDAGVGLRAVRQIRIAKLRGSEYLSGSHVFTITKAGVTIHPRCESAAAGRTAAPMASHQRVPTGIAALDAMLGGGLPVSSSTLVLGAPGSGKTLLSLNVLASVAAAGHTAVCYSFHESPDILLRKAASIGLHLEPHAAAGRLELHWRLPVEGFIDEFAGRLLGDVRRHRPACAVIDGLDGLRQMTAFPERTNAFFTALAGTLRADGVTLVLTAETGTLLGAEVALPTPPVSAFVDNILLLRYVERHSRLHRLLSVVKIRESDHDTSIREFVISAGGLDVGEPFRGAEAILSGTAHERPDQNDDRTSRTRGHGQDDSDRR